MTQLSQDDIQSAITTALSHCRFGNYDYMLSSADVPKITDMFTKALSKQAKHSKQSPLLLATSLLTEAAQSITKDSFSECFESPAPAKTSLLKRIIILFFLLPLRIFLFAFTLIFGATTISLTTGNLSLYFYNLTARLFCLSFGASGTIKGEIPPFKPGQLIVSNHSSTLDYALFCAVRPFGIVGQKHTGVQGFVERFIVSAVQPLMFDRTEKKEREKVQKGMENHIFSKLVKTNLLVFPEGVCVNASHVVQFKRGAFGLGADVVPAVLTYGERSTAAYHNSKEKSFLRYMLSIFCQWELEYKIEFLPIMRREKDEAVEEFAKRVQMAIAKAGNLIPRQWDGFLKYVKVSDKVREERRRGFARSLGVSLDEVEGGSGEESSTLSVYISEGQ